MSRQALKKTRVSNPNSGASNLAWTSLKRKRTTHTRASSQEAEGATQRNKATSTEIVYDKENSLGSSNQRVPAARASNGKGSGRNDTRKSFQACRIDGHIDFDRAGFVANDAEVKPETIQEARGDDKSYHILFGHFYSMSQQQESYASQVEYMNRQVHITSNMRATLLDWMMEVCQAYLLRRETLYYAINYVDRYLSQCSNVERGKLQLVGVTSMFIAAKMEEVYPPSAIDFAELTENAYSVAEILTMERTFLQILNWHLTPSTPFTWLTWFSKAIELCHPSEKKSHHYSHDNGSHHLHRAQNESFAVLSSAVDNVTEMLQGSHASELTCNRLGPHDVLVRKAMRLLDFVVLDIESVRYTPQTLAATALLLIFPSTIRGTFQWILRALPCADLLKCKKWMSLFFHSMPRDEINAAFENKLLDEVPLEEHYTIQPHTPDCMVALCQVLEALHKRREGSAAFELEETNESVSQLFDEDDNEDAKECLFASPDASSSSMKIPTEDHYHDHLVDNYHLTSSLYNSKTAAREEDLEHAGQAMLHVVYEPEGELECFSVGITKVTETWASAVDSRAIPE